MMRSETMVAVAIVLLSSPPVGFHPSASAMTAGDAQQSGQAGRSARRKEAAVPFRVGETLTYDVSWSSFLVAGTASTTVKEKRTSFNSTAYAIVAEGRPLPALSRLFVLYYKIDTLVDSFTLLSQQGSIYSEEGDRYETATTTFDRRTQKAVFDRRNEGTDRKTFAVPTQTQDGLALLYALRVLALKPGSRIEVPVTNDGELFTVSVDVSGPERVRVPLGTVDALNLMLTILDADRQPVARNTAVWISTDAERLPVKLQAELPVGSFVLALREVR